MVIFYSYVSLPEGILIVLIRLRLWPKESKTWGFPPPMQALQHNAQVESQIPQYAYVPYMAGIKTLHVKVGQKIWWNEGHHFS